MTVTTFHDNGLFWQAVHSGEAACVAPEEPNVIDSFHEHRTYLDDVPDSQRHVVAAVLALAVQMRNIEQRLDELGDVLAARL